MERKAVREVRSIWYLFRREIVSFMSGKSQGILKSDVCGNHVQILQSTLLTRHLGDQYLPLVERCLALREPG